MLNCDLVPVLDNKSALIFCINVAFSLLSASVPQVVAIVPNVPILFASTVADTSKPAEISAPEVFLELFMYESFVAVLLYFLLSFGCNWQNKVI